MTRVPISLTLLLLSNVGIADSSTPVSRQLRFLVDRPTIPFAALLNHS
jgi:hypothetical protein